MENALSKSWKISPLIIQDAIILASRASRLEVQTEQKPGNVNPSQSMEKTTYQHFLLAIEAIEEKFHAFFTHTDNFLSKLNANAL